MLVNMVDPKPTSCAHSVRGFQRAPRDQFGTVAGVWWKKGKRSEGSFEGPGLVGLVPANFKSTYGGFHKWGTPEWMAYNIILMGSPIEMDDLGVPPFQKTSTTRKFGWG